ncbi:hypothetical protein [Aeromonas phage AerS_266]|nr:hypothetical protein [Aeromonas phage AerS_266]
MNERIRTIFKLYKPYRGWYWKPRFLLLAGSILFSIGITSAYKVIYIAYPALETALKHVPDTPVNIMISGFSGIAIGIVGVFSMIPFILGVVLMLASIVNFKILKQF